jgi:hypothetical protein
MDLYEESIKKKTKTTKFWMGNTVKWINVSQVNEKYDENAVWNIITQTLTGWMT